MTTLLGKSEGPCICVYVFSLEMVEKKEYSLRLVKKAKS